MDGSPERKGLAWAVAAVVVLAALVFANTLPGDFVYDDLFVVVRNPVLRSADALAHPPTWARHVKTLSMALDLRVWGLNPAGFHLTNVLLHALAAALVVLLGARLGGSRSVGLAAGVLFAVHPVQAEPVAAISHRGDPLATVFGLAALLLAAGRGRPLARWAGFTCLTALSALSKETIGVVLPLLACGALLLLADGPVRERMKRAIPPAAMLLLGGAAGIALFQDRIAERFSEGFIRALTRGATGSYGDLLWTEASALRTFVGLLFRPDPLSVFHTLPILTSPLAPGALAGWAVLALLLAAAAASARRAPVACFGILWFLLALAPVLNLVPVNQFLVAARYLYFPSVGFFLAAAWTAAAVYRRAQRTRLLRGLLLLFAVSIPCTLGALSVRRNFVWLDSLALWSDTALKAPESAAAANGLGAAYYALGIRARAEAEFRRALLLDPAYVKALDNLARCYAEGNDRLGEAEELARRALAADPSHYHALATLAEIAYRQGDTARALALVEEAMRLDRGKRSLDSYKHYDDEYREQMRRYEKARDRQRSGGPQ